MLWEEDAHREVRRGDTCFVWCRLEPLTKTRWWQVLLVWGPVCLYLCVRSLRELCVSLSIGLFLFGLLMWSLLEYILHRFVFHFPEEKLPDNGAVRVVHFLLHAVHHMLPMDPLRCAYILSPQPYSYPTAPRPYLTPTETSTPNP